MMKARLASHSSRQTQRPSELALVQEDHHVIWREVTAIVKFSGIWKVDGTQMFSLFARVFDLTENTRSLTKHAEND
jgi:hypothetical protein